MWVELDEQEVRQVVDLVGPGTIRDKLTEKPHSDGERFRQAANAHDDYTHVPSDGPIERTHNGAYVLTWLWVCNESAGFMELTDFEDHKIANTTRERLEALREF